MDSLQVAKRLKIERNFARIQLNKLAKFKMIKKIPIKRKCIDQNHMVYLYKVR